MVVCKWGKQIMNSSSSSSGSNNWGSKYKYAIKEQLMKISGIRKNRAIIEYREKKWGF